MTFAVASLSLTPASCVAQARFFNVGGVMPFYSVERLSDAEISDILAALDLPAE